MKTKLLLQTLLLTSFFSFAQIDLVKDIYPGDKDSNINFLGTYKNEVYFSAVPTSYFSTLHKYNGTEIIEIKDENDNNIKSPTNFIIKDEIAYFTANINNVIAGYSYDGTTFKKIVERYFYNPIIYKNKIYFNGNSGGFGEKYNLWITDGSENGTSKFKEVETFNSYKSHIWQHVIANDLLFFVARTPETGIELWKTDGTQEGTSIVKNIYNGDGDADPEDFFVASNGLLYFTAKTETEGRELWVTDGTEEGTLMLKDFYTGTKGGDFYLTEKDNYVYIALEDTSDNLYVTDGTPAGTSTVNPNITAKKILFNYNGFIYFYGSKSGESGDLFITDGTENGTKILKSGLDVDRSVAMKLYKNEVYFNGDFENLGEELWKTDGTESGTVLVKDIGSGTIEDGYVNNLNVVGDMLIFQAYQHAATGLELWKTDGTEDGTTLIADVNPGRNSFLISKYYIYDNSLLLSAEASADIGKELYEYKNQATASTSNLFLQNINVFHQEQKLHIKGLNTSKSSLKIYNLLGQKIKDINFTSNGNAVINVNAKSGIYIVNIKTETGNIFSKKFIIK